MTSRLVFFLTWLLGGYIALHGTKNPIWFLIRIWKWILDYGFHEDIQNGRESERFRGKCYIHRIGAIVS